MENVNGISVKELTSLLEKMKKRLSVSNHSGQTIVNYLRSVEYSCKHTGKEVSFEYTDRADDYKKKVRTLKGVDFIKLFLQHVLPARFMKIRNYGFLSSRNKTNMLEKLHQHLSSEMPPVKNTCQNRRLLKLHRP